MEWTIKRAENMTGIPADTLRYYEKEGMLTPKRHENGYRYYTEEDIRILKNISVMKYAHFTVSEMKAMEELFRLDPSSDCNELSKRILTAKISELNQAISNYKKIVELMEKFLPLINSAEDYRCNKKQIDEFINGIYENIKHAEH